MKTSKKTAIHQINAKISNQRFTNDADGFNKCCEYLLSQNLEIFYTEADIIGIAYNSKYFFLDINEVDDTFFLTIGAEVG